MSTQTNSITTDMAVWLTEYINKFEAAAAPDECNLRYLKAYIADDALASQERTPTPEPIAVQVVDDEIYCHAFNGNQYAVLQTILRRTLAHQIDVATPDHDDLERVQELATMFNVEAP